MVWRNNGEIYIKRVVFVLHIDPKYFKVFGDEILTYAFN